MASNLEMDGKKACSYVFIMSWTHLLLDVVNVGDSFKNEVFVPPLEALRNASFHMLSKTKKQKISCGLS